MGLCESHISRQPSDTVISQNTSNKGAKNPTFVIQKDLRTINEEPSVFVSQKESLITESQNPSMYVANGTLIEPFQPFYLYNTNKAVALHCHKIKLNHNQLLETTVCENRMDEYNQWELQTVENTLITNRCEILIRHKFTDFILTAEVPDLSNLLIGCIERKDKFDPFDFWIVEFASEFLHDESLIKILHKKSKLYLSRSNQQGVKENHRLVTLRKYDNLNSLWRIKKI